jgi:hypothetical protein
MKPKLTRRYFLKSSLRSSLIAGGCVISSLALRAPLTMASEGNPITSQLDPKLTKLLKSAMDEIIPAAGGMPSASGAGGIHYLKQLVESEPLIKKRLERSLQALDALSRKEFKKGFLEVSPEERVEALRRLERQDPPETFGDLRDHIYESYYTQPNVWKLIGYDFHPTNHQGPHMKPFEESALSNVKKMGKLFREVS